MTEIKKRPGIRSLKTAADVARLQAKLIRAFNNDEISEKKLRALTYALTALSKFQQADALESRLEEIETKMSQIEEEFQS